MAKLSFNIYNVLILIGCVQGILLAILLIRNSHFQKKSNLFLAITLTSFSSNNLYYFLFDIGITRQHPILYYLPMTCSHLIPVSFYFFVKHLIHPNYRSSAKQYWLWVPFLMQLVFQVMTLILFIVRSPLLFKHFNAFGAANRYVELSSIVYAFIVLLVVLVDVSRYQRKLKDNYSSLNNKTLGWLQNLVIGLFALWMLWSFPTVYEFITHRFQQWHHYPLWIGMSIIIYWIGYSAYSRSEVFRAPDFDIERDALRPIPILSEKTDQHYQRLLEVMETQKPYLNPELDLNMLAKEIDISSGYLSQIINKKEKSSFYDFINKYRVNEVKRILKDSKFQHYSLLAIGLEAGFNSKSTFNSSFKKFSGSTPSDFRKRLTTVERS